jgi:ribosomal protein S18 acetylase RimI-like enzyme
VRGDLVTLVPADDETLGPMYVAVRSHDLRLDGHAAGTRQLLALQLAAQRREYHRLFPTSSWHVIQAGGVPVGWIVVDRGATEIRCLDIGLLERVRRQGIASHVLGDLQRDAARAELPVVLTVRSDNVPARAVYDRLGFLPAASAGGHLQLTWRSVTGARRPS